MAGHSKFKNIQHRKNAQDKKKAKLFTRVVREIISAAKTGAPEPEHNPRLRQAIISARVVNLPKDRIDKAINQAQASGEDFNYVDIRYEGYAPGGIALIVEASTNNKNRTAAEVRSIFNKYGGNLGETGSVSFTFDKLGFIEYEKDAISDDKLIDIALEIGAFDTESNEDYHIIYTQVEDLNETLQKAIAILKTPADTYIGWRSHNLIEAQSAEKLETLQKMIDLMEDSDDVNRVFTNCIL
jgi:YebC/PmpR family DNA-binding regulatory protein